MPEENRGGEEKENLMYFISDVEQRKNQENRYEQDFDQIIKRELELHGYAQNEPKGFDYLTNPGGAPQ